MTHATTCALHQERDAKLRARSCVAWNALRCTARKVREVEEEKNMTTTKKKKKKKKKKKRPINRSTSNGPLVVAV